MTARLKVVVNSERKSRLLFEKHVREELKFMREQMARTNEALDLLLQAAELDEKRHEAEERLHG